MEKSSSPIPTLSMSSTSLGQQQKGKPHFTSRILPASYVLSDNDVLCGRGARCFNHVGNQRFRLLVESQLERYSCDTASKLDKSAIIQDVVNFVRSKSTQGGGFVKLDPISNQYCEVGDFLAREKTSQAFRDALHDRYKSSNEKKRRRNDNANDHTVFSKPVFVPGPLAAVNRMAENGGYNPIAMVTPMNSSHDFTHEALPSSFHPMSMFSSNNNTAMTVPFQAFHDMRHQPSSAATFASISAQLEMIQKRIDELNQVPPTTGHILNQHYEQQQSIQQSLPQGQYTKRFSITTSYIPLNGESSFSNLDELPVCEDGRVGEFNPAA